MSPHPSDHTLTTDNVMEVVKGVEDRWWGLGFKLGIPDSKLKEIEVRSSYQNDHHRMEALVDYYITHFTVPEASWKAVAGALKWMKLHKQADEVTTKYVKGMDVIM